MSEDVTAISKVIAIWGWHLLGFMFFLKGLGFLVADMYAWAFGLFGVFALCEIISLNKKWRLQDAS